jgi:hypothetical protein
VDLEKRTKHYASLSTRLTYLNDDEIRRLIAPVRRPQRGVGSSGVVFLNEDRIFVKRIPLSHLEFNNPFNTHNLHQLPLYYSYGVGSFGLGAWREVAASRKTTSWVLDASSPHFPLTYHHRVVELRGRRARLADKALSGYVSYWNNNARIGDYMAARSNASHEVILFQEYIPHTLRTWLPDNLEQTPAMFEQARKMLNDLRDREVVHFDSHHMNYLTDGTTCYLTDFGLAMDREFSLTIPEQKFLERNRSYDWVLFAAWAPGYILDRYRTYAAEQPSLVIAVTEGNEPADPFELNQLLLKNLEYLSEPLNLPLAYVREVLKIRDTALAGLDFYRRLIKRKTTKFDDRKHK